MAERTVTVRLRAAVDQFRSAMHQAGSSVDGLGDKIAKESKKSTTALDKLARIGGSNGLVNALGLSAAAYGAWKLADATGDLNEAVNKSNVVFGKASKSVDDWSDASAKSMGLSKRAATEAAATYGNLFVTLGMGQTQAAGMSMSLVKLAGDLASFNNTDPTEALDALRAGLVGETEPLRRFGVNLNEATLKQKAMQLGLSDGKGVLDANSKAQAAYALILEQTGTAQGDFARTSDGLANSQRILAAEFENAKAKAGEALLPLMTDLTQAAAGALSAFSSMPKPLRDGAVAMAAVGAAAVLLAPRLVATRDALIAMGNPRLAAGMMGVAGALGKIGAAIFAVQVAGSALESNKGFTGWLSSGTKDVEDFGEALHAVAAEDAPGKVGNAIAWLSDQIVDHETYLEKAQAALSGYDGQLAQLVAEGKSDAAKRMFGDMADEADRQGISVDELRGLLPQYAAAQDEAAGATGRAAAATREQTEALQQNADTILDSARAALQLEEAEARATEAAKGLQDGSKNTKQEIRDGKNAMLDAADAAAKQAEQEAILAGVTDTTAVKNKAYRDELARLRKDLDPKNPLRAYLDGLIAQLDAAAKDRTAKLTLQVLIEGATPGSPAAARLAQDGWVAAKGKAAGGPVSAGTPYWVGERGPEMFVPPTTGRIVPSGQLSRVGYDAPPIEVHTTSVLTVDGRELARVVNVRNARDGRR